MLARSLFAAACLLVTHNAVADFRVAEIFSDQMVLQREMDVPVWGWSNAGDSVKVSFGGQNVSAKADATGKWMARLSPMEANATGQTMTVETSSGETATFSDVLVGEVWMAAGQSNMNAGGPDKPTGVYPQYQSPDTVRAPMRIRGFGFGTDPEPVEDFPAVYRDNKGNGWKKLEIGDSTAIPEYFTRVVRDGLDVPVGMIRVAFSGTNQAAWMSKESLDSFELKSGNFYQEMKEYRDAALAKKPKKTTDGFTISTYDEFREYQKKWLDAPEGRYPGGGLREMDFVNWPAILYNTRIHPLAPFAMRGVIWHQGEAGPGEDYDKHLIAMFKQWRELFGQNLYFLWGTLARNTDGSPPLEPIRGAFYRSNTNVNIRKATELADERMEMVEFYDLGYSYTHWLQKAESGRRMGLAALDLVYNQDHLYSGPRMTDIEAEGGEVRVKFTHVGERLIYEPNINGNSGIVLISTDQKARWGNVEVVDKDTIKVSHPDIAEVGEIGYAIHPNPLETLFNSAGLPASPFEKSFKDVGGYHDPKATTAIVEVLNKGADLNLGHVRRDGYSFDLQSKNPTEVQIRAYIPAEWPDIVVQHAGEPVPFETTDNDGQKFVTFAATSDGKPYAVTTKESAAKFATIHRY